MNAQLDHLDAASAHRARPAGPSRLTGLARLFLAVAALLPLAACEKEELPPPRPRDNTRVVAQSASHYDNAPASTRPDGEPLGPTPGAVAFGFPTGFQAAAQPAEKPTSVLPTGASCVTPACHARFATANHLHGALATRRCDLCHESDTGTHSFPLKRQGGDLCGFCHTVSGTQAVQHKAVSEPGCIACHDPHAANANFLLHDANVGNLCNSCHDMSVKRFAHSAVSTGQCSACHQPHQSDNKHLLRGGEGAAACLSCHKDLGEAMAGLPFVHEPVNKDCTTCHQAHSSENEHLLTEKVRQTCVSCHKEIAKEINAATTAHGAIFTEESCANCHQPHAGNRPHLLADRADHLCLRCHNKDIVAGDGRTIPDMRESLKRKFLHGPVRSGDCDSCHDVHGGARTALLKQSFPSTFYASFDLTNFALCFRCHDQNLVLSEKTANLTDFRDGEVNLHYLHVHRQTKGRTCKTCHDMHGSDLPNHVATSVPFEGSQWAMPIRFQKSAQGGSCAPGCHDPRRYNRDSPATTQPATPTGGAS